MLKSRVQPRLTTVAEVGIIYRLVRSLLASGPGGFMLQYLRAIWSDEQGQDIAEYAVMLAVILVLVIGTVRLIGGNANNAFSSVASSLSQ